MAMKLKLAISKEVFLYKAERFVSKKHITNGEIKKKLIQLMEIFLRG